MRVYWLHVILIDRWSYTLTVRRPEVRGQVVEIKTQITSRDYSNMLEQRDPFHLTILKKRRCFLYHNQYFQLDIYKEPCHPRYMYLAIQCVNISLKNDSSQMPWLSVVGNIYDTVVGRIPSE